MTPAPISVERFDLYGVSYVRATDHDASIAALLHQLAELQAENRTLESHLSAALNEVAASDKQIEAAERAREEATGLLREVEPEINELSNIYYSEFSNTKREKETEALHSRIAAFLAAGGGGGHVSPAGAPTAQQPLDESANNAGVATGSRNDSPSESVTRGSLPASDSICDALTAEWQAMGLYDATPAAGGPRE